MRLSVVDRNVASRFVGQIPLSRKEKVQSL